MSNFLDIEIWRRPICLLSRSSTPCQGFSCQRVPPGVRPDVWPDVQAARVSPAAPKKKTFDRDGLVWPPRSNVTNDSLREGVRGGLCQRGITPLQQHEAVQERKAQAAKAAKASQGKPKHVRTSQSKPKQPKASQSTANQSKPKQAKASQSK